MNERSATLLNATEHLPTISGLVPTYRRVADLSRCVEALRAQKYPLCEIVVVARPEDEETWEYLAVLPPHATPVRPVRVTVPGQVQAINAGLDEVRGEIVGVTDDDAEPHSDWSLRIARAFAAAPRVAGVGGRDNVHHGDRIVRGSERRVGRVPKIGKIVGNHHVGVGGVRSVDVLKGVNGAYRTALVREIKLDTRLRGTGAQVHWEVGLGLRLRRNGWNLLYDPEILVEHYVAPRFDEDQRNAFNSLALKNAAYNEGLIRLEFLHPIARIGYAIWAVGIGTRATPGFVQWLRFFPKQRDLIGAKTRASIEGFYDAWCFHMKTTYVR